MKRNLKRQEERREEAKVRQAAYEKLTPKQKLNKLGNHKATKQRKLLSNQ